MNKLLFIVAMFCGLSTQAQIKVQLKENIATQLIFPVDIESFRGGFDPDNFIEPQEKKNSLYIQPLGEFKETNLSVITTDGRYYSIILNYSDIPDHFYVIKKEMAIYCTTSEDEKAKALIPNTTENMTKDGAISNILQKQGYLSSRNTVKYKSFYLAVTGIYVKDNKVYIRLQCDNQSQIPYKIENFSFAINVKTTGQTTSGASEILTPTDSYLDTKIIAGKSTKETVFEFDKFTIGKENVLQIDIVEAQGARNLSLVLTDDIFLSAKQI